MWFFKKPFLNYGCFGFSLATLSLPLYVFVPKFYADNYGLSLSILGALILITRTFDAVQDPFLGFVSERLIQKNIKRTTIILCVIPLLMMATMGLLSPMGIMPISLWFTVFMVLVYTSYSAILINYYALAPAMSQDYEAQTRLTASREGWGLMGVVITSICITWLLNHFSQPAAFMYYGLIFSIILFSLGIFSMLTTRAEIASHPQKSEPTFAWSEVLKDKPFRNLCLGYFLSNTASSFPAAFFLFYLEEVIHSESYSGLFLALYFISGVISMPAWPAITTKFGKKNTWVLSMFFAVAAFFWAGFLRGGDIYEFGFICILSGLALGADLSIPPALLADTLEGKGTSRPFGIWTMITKMTIAMGGGLAFFSIDFGRSEYWQEYGYSMEASVAFLYAFLPCVIKIIAGFYIYRFVTDRKFN